MCLIVITQAILFYELDFITLDFWERLEIWDHRNKEVSIDVGLLLDAKKSSIAPTIAKQVYFCGWL